MYKDSRAKIISRQFWDEYHLISLESPRVAEASQPGQFIMVKVTEHAFPLLRRPFSIHSRAGKNLEIFFKVSGLGTEALAQKKTGDSLDIIGPLGKGFLTEPASAASMIYLVGGGRGIAPLYFLGLEMVSRNFSPVIFYGGRSVTDLVLKERISAKGFHLACSTDDGSYGFKGFVTEFLSQEGEKKKPDYLYACGPEPMLKAVAGLAGKWNVPAQLSLESMMGCGFGACWGCVRRILRNGSEQYLKTCEEGPVFHSTEIIWEEESDD